MPEPTPRPTDLWHALFADPGGFDGVRHDRIAMRSLVLGRFIGTASWVIGRNAAREPGMLDSSAHNAFLRRHRTRFLRHQELFFDVLPGRVKGDLPRITCELYAGRTTAIAARHGARHYFYLYIGRVPLCLVDLQDNAIHVPDENSQEDIPALLTHFIAHLVTRRLGYDDLFGNMTAAGPRFLVISDERPTHFVQETLGFLAKNVDVFIIPFLKSGGRLAIARDRCLVDPVGLFPGLGAGDILYSDTSSLICNLTHGASFFHNVYRATDGSSDSQAAFDLLRADIGDADNWSGPCFQAHIVLDTEKSRFLNQISCLKRTVAQMAAACDTAGVSLRIAFDGWTPSCFAPSDRDRAMHDAVSRVAQDIMDGSATEFEVISDRPFASKARILSPFDISLSSHGTGALLPCKILRIPTVTYGVPDAMWRDYEVDERYNHKLPSDLIVEQAHAGILFHRRRFEIDETGFSRFVTGKITDILALRMA